MILGMSLSVFTQLHVALSLLGIVSGFAVVFGMIRGSSLPRLTAFFLVTTALTSLTGFLFPWRGVTPGIVVGVLSLIVLSLAAVARYLRHLARAWRSTWVLCAALALYFNVFVLIVQLFEKVPALHVLAPTQKESPFRLAQMLALIFFLLLTAWAMRRFRGAVLRAA